MFKSHTKLMVMKHLRCEPSSGYDLIKYFLRYGQKISPGYLYPLLENLRINRFISIKKIGRKKICSTTKKGNNLLNNLETKYQEMVIAMGELGDKSEMRDFSKLKFGNTRMIEEKERLWEIRKLIIISAQNKKKSQKILDETIRKLKELNRKS